MTVGPVPNISLAERAPDANTISPHRIGGPGVGAPTVLLPDCPFCAEAMAIAASIDLGDPTLEFAVSDAAWWTALYCPTCDATSDTTVHYRPSRSRQSLMVCGDVDPLEPLEPDRVEAFAANRRVPAAKVLEFGPAREPSFDGPFHQWGGEPLWLGEALEPDCHACRVPMTFVMQLDSDENAGLAFGDFGMLYAFCCVFCGETATLIQNASS